MASIQKTNIRKTIYHLTMKYIYICNLKIAKKKNVFRIRHQIIKIIFYLIILNTIFPCSNQIKHNRQYLLYSSKIIIKYKESMTTFVNCGMCDKYPQNHPDLISHLEQENYNGQSVKVTELIWNDLNDFSYLFCGCNKIVEIDLSKLDISAIYSVETMIGMFKNCASLVSIKLSSFKTNAKYMGQMFMGCISLVSLDLSNFTSLNAQHIDNMFNGCSSLISLKLNNFYTNNVIGMGQMFAGCTSLVSLDLSSFETTKVIHMDKVFSGCGKLQYINLKNVKTSPSTDISDIFQGMPKKYVICINNTFNSKINNLITNSDGCSKIDCSENWEKVLKTIKTDNDICVDDCTKRNKFELEEESKCYSKCPEGMLPNEQFKCQKCELNSTCIWCSILDSKSNLCLNCTEGYYPIYNDPNIQYPGKVCHQSAKGYFLDKEISMLKSCYPSCEECYREGTEFKHNCSKCKPDFTFEIIYENDSREYRNCYKICPNYIYFDIKLNKSLCTNELKCPVEYNKLISDKKICINDCAIDKDYQYEFRKQCYSECPEGSIKSETKDFYCEANCSSDYPFYIISTQECVNYCPINDYINNLCILKYKSGENENIIIKNIEKGLITGDYDTSKLEQGFEDRIGTEKMVITLTTIQNQKERKNNSYTAIDLGNCETLLRANYCLSEKEPLFLKKIDVEQLGMKIPKTEFDIYAKLNGSNLVKLNKSICEKSTISITVPFEIKDNIEKYNTNSSYYNDICYKAKSESGTDILLADRKKEFIEENKTVCQDDCFFYSYYEDIKVVNCSCKVKETSPNFEDMTINITKLSEDLGITDKNQLISNFGITSCNVITSGENIKSNTGFYLLLFILIIFIIIFIVFCIRGYEMIENKINEVIYKKFNNEIKNNNHKNNIIKNKEVNKIRIESKKNSKTLNKNSKKMKKKTSQNINHSHTIHPNKSSNKTYSRKDIQTLGIDHNNNIIKESLEMKPDTDYELNWFDYTKALKWDKRTGCEYYWALMRSKQLIIFSFCSFNDYNSGIIKKFLFFCHSLYIIQ